MPISGFRPTHRRRGRPARGFSLFEMIMVVALLAGFTAMAATAFAPAAGRARLKTEAAEIGAVLATSRNRAITGRADMRLLLDAGRQTIIAGDPAMVRQLPPSLTMAVMPQSGGSQLEIVFFPDGGATGGSFLLSDGTQAITFHIDWLTGRVATATERLHAN
jgi:general secretion pathway protein H